MTDQVVTYEGVALEDLSREKLIEAVRYVAAENRRLTEQVREMDSYRTAYLFRQPWRAPQDSNLRPAD